MSDDGRAMCDAEIGTAWLCARPAGHPGPHRSRIDEDEWPEGENGENT